MSKIKWYLNDTFTLFQLFNTAYGVGDG